MIGGAAVHRPCNNRPIPWGPFANVTGRSRPAAAGHGRQLPGELNFIAMTLYPPVIERMGTSMYLREHHYLNVALGFDHLIRFEQMYQQVMGELPAQTLAMRRWTARQPTDAAA